MSPLLDMQCNSVHLKTCRYPLPQWWALQAGFALRPGCLGSQADRDLLAAGLPDAVDIVYGNVGNYVSCKAAMEDIDKVSHA